MAHSVGRELAGTELVHHHDDNPHNNRLENLMLVSRAEHFRLHHAMQDQLYACMGCGQLFLSNRRRERARFHSLACYKAYRDAHGLKDLRPPRKPALPS
jgi:HNH endonuclease